MAIVNSIAGIAVSTVALVWAFVGVRTHRPTIVYRVALWVAATALLVNIAVIAFSVTVGIEPSTPVVFPVSSR